MSLQSPEAPYVDWRLETIRAMPGKQVQVNCTGDILDTIFFSADWMPFHNPQAAIACALTGYWKILERASHSFTAMEWKALSAMHSPFSRGAYADMTPAEAAATVEREHSGDEWNDEILAIKALLPKVARLSSADFAAVNEILRYLGSLSSDDPLFTMSRKLPALEQPEPGRS